MSSGGKLEDIYIHHFQRDTASCAVLGNIFGKIQQFVTIDVAFVKNLRLSLILKNKINTYIYIMKVFVH